MRPFEEIDNERAQIIGRMGTNIDYLASHIFEIKAPPEVENSIYRLAELKYKLFLNYKEAAATAIEVEKSIEKARITSVSF